MLAVILVNNSKEDADKYVHADNNEYNKEQTGPWIVIIGRHPGREMKIIITKITDMTEGLNESFQLCSVLEWYYFQTHSAELSKLKIVGN